MDESTFDFPAALRRLLAEDGSDLHLKVGNRPLLRIGGELRPIDDSTPQLEHHDTEEVLHQLIPESRIAEFEERHELDFAYAAPGLARFRVNAFKQRGTISLVLRVVPASVMTVAELGLPDVVSRLAEEERGIVLVTGTTGSGKSTTLAAMVEQINDTACRHIVTIEDPIEYMHADHMASIDQREVGMDTDSFRTALRHVMRQDPDVIMIGEMRDEETARAALSAAETGHLVLSTLHTLDSPETINRIIELFGNEERHQVRGMFAGTLKGIISQRLVPSVEPDRRVAICEVLTMTGRVHDLIIDPSTEGSVKDVIQEGDFYGMQTFDQDLFKAYNDGRITQDAAVRAASHPHDLKLMIATQGHTSTTMADVEQDEPPDDAPAEPQPAPGVATAPAADIGPPPAV